MRFESGKGLKKKRKKENVFCKLENLFIFLLFFIIHFPLHFKNDF